MAKTRLELHAALEEFMGNKNVYFQPPESFKIKYPCIIYDFDRVDQVYADNTTYLMNDKYVITVIYREADATYKHDLLRAFNSIRYDRHYKSENLYHDVFTIVW